MLVIPIVLNLVVAIFDKALNSPKKSFKYTVQKIPLKMRFLNAITARLNTPWQRLQVQ